jgi:hypothetical protein
MDRSSNYIKMCESKEEIQEQWQPEFGDFYTMRACCMSFESNPQGRVPAGYN